MNKQTTLLTSVIVLLTLSCSDPLGTDPEESSVNGGDIIGIQLSVVSGDAQSALPGERLADPLVARVEDDKGKPVEGQIVNFHVIEGGGAVFAGAAISNKEGIVQELWTLGLSGLQRVEARAVDTMTGEALTFAVFTAALIDIEAPVVSDLVVTPNPALTWDAVDVSASVADGAGSIVTGAEYMIDCVGEDKRICRGLVFEMSATDGAFDEPVESVTATTVPLETAGDYEACVRATDAAGNTSDWSCVPLTVEDVQPLLAGTWLLDPVVTLSCGFIPAGFGEITVSRFEISPYSEAELAVVIPLNIGIISDAYDLELIVPFDPGSGSFGGTFPIEFSDELAQGSGSLSLNGEFSDLTSFEATLEVSLELTVNAFGFTFDGQCDDLNAELIGTRL